MTSRTSQNLPGLPAFHTASDKSLGRPGYEANIYIYHVYQRFCYVTRKFVIKNLWLYQRYPACADLHREMAGLVGDDYIFIQTDPLFSLVLYVTNELRGRIPVVNSQSTSTRPIRGNNDGVPGGHGPQDHSIWPGGTEHQSRYHFSNTASAVFRLAMLTATNCCPHNKWPNGPSKDTPARDLNEGSLRANFAVALGQPFSLANDYATMRKYYSKYDQNVPSFVHS